MSMFQRILAWRGKMTIDDLAMQLAEANWQRVWARLSNQIWQMSRHERRGYVRARGALLVQDAVEAALQTHPRRGAMTELYARTMDHVTRQIAGHMAHVQTPARQLRRAA